jgi:ferritin-like metal-binding protein YciE
MSDPNERDAKLVQYLNEAHGKELELIAELQVDIEMTTKKPYKKRLQRHLRETKGHAKALERRIKKLGGGSSAVQALAAKTKAAAKSPLHKLRGSGEQEKMLKNAKTQYSDAHESVSTYLALEAFATRVNDRETAKLARDIRRDEERMAKFLEGQVKSLAGATAQAEVPAAQRRAAKATKSKRAKATKSKRAKASAAKPKRAKAKAAKKARKAKATRKATKPSKAKSAKAKAAKSKSPKAKSRKAKSTKQKSAKKTRAKK